MFEQGKLCYSETATCLLSYGNSKATTIQQNNLRNSLRTSSAYQGPMRRESTMWKHLALR